MSSFKKFQNTIISTYRISMTSVLLVIVVGVLSYLFLMIFYAVNRNWSVPVVLSPTQETVLAFQPQIAALEATVLKNKVDLDTAKHRYEILRAQIPEIDRLIQGFDAARGVESRALAANAAHLHEVLAHKRADIARTRSAIAQFGAAEAAIDTELAAGLITKDEAMVRRLSLQSASNSVTDSQIGEIALQEQARMDSAASTTLARAGSTSLPALQSVQSLTQLRILRAQTLVDAETARLSIEQLDKSVAQAERVLAIARQSPYYMALTGRVPVVFVQYDNQASARPGGPVYDCYLQVILCRQVGTTTQVYDAEQYARHPLFKTDIKGRFVGVRFTAPKSSESSILFLGHKPLFL